MYEGKFRNSIRDAETEALKGVLRDHIMSVMPVRVLYRVRLKVVDTPLTTVKISPPCVRRRRYNEPVERQCIR